MDVDEVRMLEEHTMDETRRSEARWPLMLAVGAMLGIMPTARAAEVYGDPAEYENAAAAVGVATQTVIDFEDLSQDRTIDDEYEGLGLVFTSANPLTAQPSVHGSSARGDLALQVGGDSPQSFTLLFDRDQRAVATYFLDINAPLTLQAYDSGGTMESVTLENVLAEDTPGGVFQGIVFDMAFVRLVISGQSGDGIGIDDFQFTSTDEDGDGYGPGDGRRGGDCDDSDPAVFPGALELLDGVDQDCDGITDNAVEVFTNESLFAQTVNGSGITFLTTIDFEDLSEGADVSVAYEGLGVYMSGGDTGAVAPLLADTDVCGSAAAGDLAALVQADAYASFSWYFQQPQSYLAARILDLGVMGLDVEAYDDGGLVNAFHVDAAAEDTARGLFRGFWFNLPVTRIVFSSPDASDCIGFDDLQFLSLDQDADGYGTATGRRGDDCDDTSPDVYPGATEVPGDGVDQDCDGIPDNAVSIYTDPATFAADGVDGGVPGFAVIDFEDLAEDESIALQYEHLGITFNADSGIIAQQDVYGSRARGQRAAQVESTEPAEWRWTFAEPQRFVAAYFLDVSQSIKVDAYAENVLINTIVLSVPGENTPGGFFRGMRFSLPVDRLEFQGVSTSDGIGFDDVYFDPVDDDQDGFTVADGDCDDLDPNVWPGAEETCNGVDDDCNGTVDEGFDLDADGVVSCETATTEADCDDGDPEVFPGHEEQCDAKDNDCDGTVDEGFDSDGDGFTACGDGNTDPDCDDTSATVYPGADEICNGLDDDCDGTVDEGFDLDADSYYVCDLEAAPADCDDANPAIYPGATEIPYNDIDEDCSGSDLTDVDGDGFDSVDAGGTDCDDQDPTTYAGADETPYDGIDQDCSGSDLTDVDGDGFDSVQIDGGTDCDDANPATYPGATEIDDDLDNDCDGSVDEELDTTDDDGDGFSEAQGDCNDTNPDIYPEAEEIPYDGLDNDCADGDAVDLDQDGFPAVQAAGTDCDDTNPDIHPDADETPYDGIDQDCSGSDLADVDGDGFDSDQVGGGTDCDDTNPDIHPDADETPYDGIDQDCSGSDLTDVDGDGHDAMIAGGADCNDNDPAINPDAPEIVDEVDNDCDGVADNDTVAYDDDQDGFTENQGDCDDSNPDVHPGAVEVADEVDNDCDGDVDEDTSASDDDGDGYTDDQGDCDDTNPDIYPGAVELDDQLDNDCDGDVDEDLDTTDDDGDGFSEVEGDCDDTDPTVYPGTPDCSETSPTPETTPAGEPTPTPSDFPGDETPAASPTPTGDDAGGCNCRTSSPAGSSPSTPMLAGALILFLVRRRNRNA